MADAPGNTYYKKAIWFSISGDIRFLSHRDTMTLWQRALLRGRLPMRYSAGFNPHIRLSLPLPRNVGMASDCELLVFELTEQAHEPDIVSTLEAQLPEGIAILACRSVPKPGNLMPQWAQYRVTVKEHVKELELKSRVEEFMHKEQWSVERPPRGRHPRRRLDIRGAITEMALNSGELCCRLEINPSATPRMDEICKALLLDPVEDIQEICRLAVGYPQTWDPIAATREKLSSEDRVEEYED